MSLFKLIIFLLIVVVIGYLASASFLTRQNKIKPPAQRALSPCPATPNCVSSLAQDQQHSISAIRIDQQQADKAWRKLVHSIHTAGGKILVDDGHYCHAVFTSAVFRFKDDVEAVLQTDHIDIRSASRAGRSDFGQNRKRVEKIRTIFQG